MFFYQLKDPSWVIAHQKSGNFDCYPAKPRRLFNVFFNSFTVYNCVIWHVTCIWLFMCYVFNSPLYRYLIKSKFLPSTCTKTTQESLLISINSDTKKRWSLLIRVYCYCTKHKGRMRWLEYVRNEELAGDGLQASLIQTVDIHSVGSNNCFLKRIQFPW